MLTTPGPSNRRAFRRPQATRGGASWGQRPRGRSTDGGKVQNPPRPPPRGRDVSDTAATGQVASRLLDREAMARRRWTARPSVWPTQPARPSTTTETASAAAVVRRRVATCSPNRSTTTSVPTRLTAPRTPTITSVHRRLYPHRHRPGLRPGRLPWLQPRRHRPLPRQPP